jgi:hypothetical protein
MQCGSHEVTCIILTKTLLSVEITSVALSNVAATAEVSALNYYDHASASEMPV